VVKVSESVSKTYIYIAHNVLKKPLACKKEMVVLSVCRGEETEGVKCIHSLS